MTDIIHLKCPDCKKSLEGENNSKVFFCRICHHCFDINMGKASKYPVEYFKSVIHKDRSKVYFPFWNIRAEYKITDSIDDNEVSERRNFFVPAFFVKNVNYFGELGFQYMQKKVAIEKGEPEDLPIFPADRGLEKSAPYPLLYLYSERTKKKKGSTPEISFKHKNFSIALIPFYRKDREYFDSVLFTRFPSGVLI